VNFEVTSTSLRSLPSFPPTSLPPTSPFSPSAFRLVQVSTFTVSPSRQAAWLALRR
jgi:hypothetical protein